VNHSRIYSKLNFKGLEQILDAAVYQYVSDNDDNPAPLTHKENIKFGKPFKLLIRLG